MVGAAMTLIGIWLSGPDRAFAWSDSECYDANRGFVPSGHVQKIAVNHHACAAVVVMGCTLMLDIAARAMAATVVFDLFIVDLQRLARRDWYPSDGCPRAGALAIGYSNVLRRMVGFSFDSREAFNPKPVITAQAFPYVSELEALHPTDGADILSFAQGQMREIQKLYPGAGAGSVTVACATRSTIGVESFDLETGRRSSGLPSLPAMGATPSDISGPDPLSPLGIRCAAPPELHAGGREERRGGGRRRRAS